VQGAAVPAAFSKLLGCGIANVIPREVERGERGIDPEGSCQCTAALLTKLRASRAESTKDTSRGQDGLCIHIHNNEAARARVRGEELLDQHTTQHGEDLPYLVLFEVQPYQRVVAVEGVGDGRGPVGAEVVVRQVE
jgi:hypothetical protein